jgi:hypothetical protein
MQHVSVDHCFAQVTSGFNPLLKSCLSHTGDCVGYRCCRHKNVRIHNDIVVLVINDAAAAFIKAAHNMDDYTSRYAGFCKPGITKKHCKECF